MGAHAAAAPPPNTMAWESTASQYMQGQ